MTTTTTSATAPAPSSPIKENSSEKRPRRGRPAAHSGAIMEYVAAEFENVSSHRGQVDMAYRLRAYARLLKDPAYRWLTGDPKSTGPLGKGRAVILTELGRIADDAALIAVAKQLCEWQPKTTDAVRAIRRYRGALRAPQKYQLARLIGATIDRYRDLYPETTWTDIADEMKTAWEIAELIYAEVDC